MSATHEVDEDLAAALAAYRVALEIFDLALQGDVEIRSPFGSRLFVARAVNCGTFERVYFDLPGFGGSASTGYRTRREVVEAVRLATRVVGDVTRLTYTADLEEMAYGSFMHS